MRGLGLGLGLGLGCSSVCSRRARRAGRVPTLTPTTAKVLGANPEEVLSKQCTAQLGRLLKAGETSKAWELFNGLLDRGHADEYHLTTMLKACLSSEKQRVLVSRAEEAGVTTTLPTYNLLLGRLRVEGRSVEAEVMLTLTLTVMLTVMLTLTLTLTVR